MVAEQLRIEIEVKSLSPLFITLASLIYAH